MSMSLTPEEIKAWSQNLGHEGVLTTFTSYGKVPVHRQGELIRTSRPVAVEATEQSQIAALESLLRDFKTPSAMRA